MSIEKLPTDHDFTDGSRGPDGELIVFGMKDDAKTLKINELIEQSNRQDRVIRELAENVSEGEWVGIVGGIVSILEGKDETL